MVFIMPLLVPVLIGLAVALWFSTYYSVFDFVKKRRKLIEGEIPRFASVSYTHLDVYKRQVFTPAAIEAGDLVIRILTPDLKGVNYLKAHQPLLVDGRFHYEQHMTFAGMARPFHALDEMGYIIGGFNGLLPYGKEIDLSLIHILANECRNEKLRIRIKAGLLER